VSDGAFDEGSTGARSPVDRGRMGRHELLVFRRESKRRLEVIVAIFRSSQDGHIGFAQPSRGLDQCIEHHLQIESRSADDFEDISSGGLLMEGFPQLVEQTRVLDRDDGLGGERLDQIDLLLSKWIHRNSRKEYDADWRSLA
jgi:hypothetical protein